MSLVHIAAGLGLLLAVLGFAVWQAAMARRWAWLAAVRFVSLITVSSAALWLFLRLAGGPLVSRLVPFFGASTQFFCVYLAVRLLDTVLFDSALSRRRGVSVPRLLRDIVRWIVAFFVLMVILRANLGIDRTPLVATSAALTFVLGFALQDVLGNLFAGIAINVEQPFSIGDRVSIDGRDGTVDNVNWGGDSNPHLRQ
ncbi:mechanosensitive ion channel [Candidatus Fermentibacteria bacterium]|nr:mechanosensitive ion channel [Candidatus Fermentibacteria bacterium]